MAVYLVKQQETSEQECLVEAPNKLAVKRWVNEEGAGKAYFFKEVSSTSVLTCVLEVNLLGLDKPVVQLTRQGKEV